ncbi:hypothetical protein CP557_02160 [Natrinema ejinorense]|uniref:Uncharacterized protein n=1 Tax=Natrinema ejinorense TaxID=373386 RepID=A0A2A5QRL5_9EURY|nr:hypothetical protein CP557_02160 [Natrinema ejinorense]
MLFLGVSTQHESATVTENVTDELHTLNETEPIVLEASDDWYHFVEGSDVVESNATGEQLERGTDYFLDNESGEITSSTEYDGATVSIDYEYTTTDDQTESIAAVVEPLAVPIAWTALIAGVGTILLWIARLPSGGGSW